ncbi:WD40-repeat-containing domain protein [Cyathus striatus]|nr:WD40-repeat-containing domain protein [Cyathus striatus]
MDKKREPTALSVHRCRFVDYAPSAITALAFPPLTLPSVKGKGKKTTIQGKLPLRFGTLAVGRANGNIDLCEWTGSEHQIQSPQAWVVQQRLPGPYPSKVDSLAFAIRYPDDFGPDDVPTSRDLRLFSSGGGSELIEWDLERSCIRRTIGSQGGSIWSIAVNPASTVIALGCEDGTVRLLSLLNDTLSHTRRFDRVKCRLLSIAWGPPVPRREMKRNASKEVGSDESDDDEQEWEDSWLVTGGSDNSLRKWNVANGRVVDKMSVDRVRGERTLVWTVGTLGNGTIISGDSLGMVKFWDSRTCTQLQSFQAHGADVLCLTISPEGNTIYTSGVDQKAVQFSLVKTASPPTTKWAQTGSKRMHSHDVRALAVWPPYTPLPLAFKRTFSIDIAPILASGGLDMNLVLAPAAAVTNTVVKITNPLDTSIESTFEDGYHRRVSYTVPGAVRIARSARLVLCTRESSITVWRIKSKPSTPEQPEDSQDKEPKQYAGGWSKVLEMALNFSTNIVASDISDDGRWLVASDLYETKLFSLKSEGKKLEVKRVKDFPSVLLGSLPESTPSAGAQAFSFSPDSSKLVLSTAMTSYILVIDLSSEKPRVLRRFEQHRTRGPTIGGRVIKGKKSETDDVNMDEADNAQEGNESNEDEEDDASPLTVNIGRLAISPDGQWLASSDDHRRTHIFNLDSISHHTMLPSFAKPVQCFAFDPSQCNTLVLAFADNSMQIYDVEARQFPTWGKDITNALPRRFTTAHDAVLGITFDPAVTSKPRSRYVLLWGATWLFKVSFESEPWRTGGGGGKKRRRDAPPAPAVEEERLWRDHKMITQYRPLLCTGFLDGHELLVVERPLVDVLSTLPPAFFKPKYGAS